MVHAGRTTFKLLMVHAGRTTFKLLMVHAGSITLTAWRRRTAYIEAIRCAYAPGLYSVSRRQR
jgi:hypothetical protein